MVKIAQEECPTKSSASLLKARF